MIKLAPFDAGKRVYNMRHRTMWGSILSIIDNRHAVINWDGGISESCEFGKDFNFQTTNVKEK